MDSKNSISDSLKSLAILQKNIINFFQRLNASLVSSSETVTIDYTQDDGSNTTLVIPSFGFLKDQVTNLNTKLEELINVNDSSIGLQFQDGTVRKFKVESLNQVIKDLEVLQDSTFAIPTDFRIKNNWFFESFLNPLLFVTLDISQYIASDTNEIDSFSVKRIIVKVDNTSDSTYFDTTYKGKNDIDLNTLISDLNNKKIRFFIDDESVDLSVAINRIRGNFSVLKKFQEDIVTTNADGSTDTVTRIKYKLDKLTYTDILDGNENTKTLKEADVLITTNGSEYSINSINKTDNTVVLTRIFGKETPNIGVDVFTIKASILRIPELQINVGYNERQVVFIKPISRTQKLTIDKYSKGIGFFSNELNITLQDGTILKLDNYYNNFVDDFGMLFINFAKERNIPSALGLIPDAPTLDLNNFKVTQINGHLTENKDTDQLKSKISTKEKLQNQISELNKTIEVSKAKLNTAETVSDTERQTIRTNIANLNTNKTNLFNQSSTLVKEITLDLKNNPTLTVDPKYSVRGFWNIPNAKTNEFGPQQIAQFKISYRYLSKKGTANNVDQIQFIDTDGTQRTGFFSNWTEVLGKVRPKQFNQNTGRFEWAPEKVEDPQSVNINQLDIPITKGEVVEIKIKSLSEAGYPINPIESDWSNTISVSFPDDLENTIEASDLSKDVQSDDIQIKFQEELNARSLDIHLLNSFTTGDKYYAHRTEDIASGFTTSANIVINLYDKLKEMQDRITALELGLAQDKGVIKVTITDEIGNVIEIKNGQTIKLFGGYYKDLITQTSGNTTVYNHGKIITKSYVISISNTSSSPLELISRIVGGIDERAADHTVVPFSNDNDYSVIRRYDNTPLSVLTLSDGNIGSFKFKAPYQSNNAKSQFIYPRYRNYGLSSDLYTDSGTSTFIPNYTYLGIPDPNNGSHIIPIDGVHYVPFDPTNSINGSSIDSNIWNGTNTGTTPNANGFLTEFCIHKDHPNLVNLLTNFSWSSNQADFMTPQFTIVNGIATQMYIPILHAYNFSTSIADATGEFGGTSKQQLQFYNPAVPIVSGNADLNFYPAKLGFASNDEFLVGKYTCGSYLFLAPSAYEDLSIEGNNLSIAKRIVETGNQNAINIPIIFQFRCSDKLEYVGGFRTSGKITNIEYGKTIGLDIYIKDQNTFSFDVDVNCKYNKDIPVLTAIDIPASGALIQKVQFTGISTS